MKFLQVMPVIIPHTSNGGGSCLNIPEWLVIPFWVIILLILVVILITLIRMLFDF